MTGQDDARSVVSCVAYLDWGIKTRAVTKTKGGCGFESVCRLATVMIRVCFAGITRACALAPLSTLLLYITIDRLHGLVFTFVDSCDPIPHTAHRHTIHCIAGGATVTGQELNLTQSSLSPVFRVLQTFCLYSHYAAKTLQAARFGDCLALNTGLVYLQGIKVELL